MMSPKAIKSASQAGHYFEKDDYYVDGLSPSEWFGDGAETLGLSGDVDRETFKSLLEGQLPDGQKLGTVRDGEWKHQPGIDLTFLAPKSVSILSEVVGDQRLLSAHDKAVQAVLRYIEQEYIVTRNRNRAENTVEYEKTASMVAATFKHTTSRAFDPLLHTHVVVMNATQRADGLWRSIENKPLFIDQKHLGLIYRQYLAEEVQSLGYGLDHEKGGTWEIASISKEVIREFSKRSEAIEKALEARGKTRDSATAAEKETATLDTRDRKVHMERGELLEKWHAEIGEDKLNDLKKVIRQSQANIPTLEMKTEALLERVKVANEAVMWATEHLGERDTSWTHHDLVKEASRYAGSRVLLSDVNNAIDAAIGSGQLIDKSVRTFDKVSKREIDVRGYTSKAAIDIEDEVLKEEYLGRDRVQALCSREQAAAAISNAEEKANEFGYEWNADQRKATEGILLSENRIVGVQGFAGTAKTTSVLRTVAETARDMGYEVRGLTPTNSAGQSLIDGAGIQSGTIQSFLAQNRNEWVQERKTHTQIDKIDKRLEQIEKALSNPYVDEKTGILIPENSPLYQKRLDELQYERSELQGERDGLGKMLEKTPQLWIVDESSMVGSKLMRDLLQRAGQSGASVVLTGDIRQLASVEAGAAFRQLQNHGMETYHLEEIVRQTNRGTRDAVYLSLMKNASHALSRLEESGSTIKEMVSRKKNGKIDHEKSGEARRQELVTDYMALAPQERAKSIILEPSREGRRRTNELVREALKKEGTLGEELRTNQLSPVDATEAERRVVTSYQNEQIVRFARSFKREGIKKGLYYQVVGRDNNDILLKKFGANEQADLIRFSPERYAAKNIQMFNLTESGLAVGETIVWRDNDKPTGRLNNDTATVEKIEGTNVTFRLSNGKTGEFDMFKLANSHWDHGYAMTVHSAQGKTAQNVFVHAETNREALLNTEQFYVQISRAKDRVYLYTDSKEGFVRAVEQRSGQKQTAKESRYQSLEPLDHLIDKLWQHPESGRSLEQLADRVQEREKSRGDRQHSLTR
ncbi:MAG: relaxase domain-containing protein [Shewanella xiamenensis]|uniref:MobF family relaxase n=1 Tax=Shewanella baltica TaxID=62322 RepID=UPI000DFA9955|nr:MobF family relaxase [Shewanella baltica]MCD8561438.1 relaxase domain-containing protein [Shewanella xiamenensis]MCS6151610.1 relaxase domain-containing protein [Shewanella baltica]SUI44761.1 Multifunctional conjugation protein TraI [Shewanella baltica]